MSEEFHVHGPHDHEVEHQAHSGDRFAGRIAVMTAILATIGALISYQGGATQNAALLFKNEAAIKKTEASDQWNFYQAKSNKQNLAELGATLTTGKVSDDYRGDGYRVSGPYKPELGQRFNQLQATHHKLEQTQNQLLQSDKMASIGQLAAGVAHEINNPVGFVNSNLGTLKTYTGNLLKLVAAYEAIDAGGERASLEAARRAADLEFMREDLPTLLRESQDGLARVTRIVQNLKDFSLAQGFGSYCVFTDASLVGKQPQKDNFKVMGSGIVELADEVGGVVTFFANEIDGKEFKAMLQAINSLKLKPAK